MYVLQNLYKLLLLNLLKFIIHLQSLQSIYEKHCKLPIKKVFYMLIDLKKKKKKKKKSHPLMFKVLKSIFLNLQIDLFMNTFALIFDFKQVQSYLYSRQIL